VLSGRVALGAHRRVAADLAFLAVMDPRPFDAPLPVAPLHHHLHRPARDVGPAQLFHHRPLPLALDAMHRGQVAPIVPTYVARGAARAEEDAVRGQDAEIPRVAAVIVYLRRRRGRASKRESIFGIVTLLAYAGGNYHALLAMPGGGIITLLASNRDAREFPRLQSALSTNAMPARLTASPSPDSAPLDAVQSSLRVAVQLLQARSQYSIDDVADESQRCLAAGTVTIKYREFSRKSICNLTRDITPAALTFSL